MVTEWPLVATSLKARDQPFVVPRWFGLKQNRVAVMGRQEIEERLRKADALRFWPMGPEHVRVGRGL